MENQSDEKEIISPEEAEEHTLELPLKLLGFFLVILFMVILTAAFALPLLDVPATVVFISIPIMVLVLIGLFVAAKKCLSMSSMELAKMIYFFQIVVPTTLISLYIVVAAIVYLYESGRF